MLRRRPKISRSSERRNRGRGTADGAPATGTRRCSAADIEALPGQRHEHVLQVGHRTEAAHRHAGVHQRGDDLGRAPRRRSPPSPRRHRGRCRPGRARASSPPRRPARSVSTRTAGPPRPAARRAGPARPACRGASPRRALQTCSTSDSRWVDSSTVAPSAASSPTSERTSRVPCGSSPLVGSSRMSRSRGAAGRRRAQALAHAERVVAVPLAGGRGEPDPVQRRGDPPARGAGSTVRSAASSRRRLSRPDRYGWKAGPSTSAPTRGSTRARPAGSPAEQGVAARGGPDQAQQHPDRGGLARAVRAEEPVHRAGGTARSTASTATWPPEPLGQAAR